MSTGGPEIVAEPSSVAIELRRVFTMPALRWSCVAILVIGLLAPLANTVTLAAHDSPRQTANAFTSMNAGVFLALLLGVFGTTGAARLPADLGPTYRRAIGVKARAYGLVGAGSVLILGGVAAAVALPIIHARGIASPSSTVIGAYFERETVAGARLALLGVAIGVVAVRRWQAVVGLVSFLVVEAIAEAYIPFVKNYGPIGALNTFSDPSHHHQLSVGAGSAIALAWALVALIVATVVSENQNARAKAEGSKWSSPRARVGEAEAVARNRPFDGRP